MCSPLSSTVISSAESARRAAEAALNPAATPPMTTRRITKRRGSVSAVLHEVENVEWLDLAAGEETVNGVLFVAKNFEDSREFGEDQQLDVSLGEIQELESAAGLAQSRKADDQGA